MSNFKTYGTVAIMIACFAVVYPRFMHPLILRVFGLQEQQRNGADDSYPPGFRGVNPSQKPPNTEKDDVRRHMRPGPHPGMRAAAEMNRQQAQQGTGRGMMGVVLPMYAVGIVLYLGYTLFKVFNKGSPKNDQWGSKKNYYNNKSRGNSSERDRMGFPKDFDGSDGSDIKNFFKDEDQRRNLEDLLTRVDDKNVSVEEMRILQKRLEETEVQMTRILRAMNSTQTNVENLADRQQAFDQMAASEAGESGPKESLSENEKNTDYKLDPRESKAEAEDRPQTSASEKSDRKLPESDRAGVEPGYKTSGSTEEEESLSAEGGNEDEESNNAFDVEDAACDEEEEEGEDGEGEGQDGKEDQETDEIIPDKNNYDEGEKACNTKARHRNVTADQKQ